MFFAHYFFLKKFRKKSSVRMDIEVVLLQVENQVLA